MSLPLNVCVLCNKGEYERLLPLEGNEDHNISALVVSKIGTNKLDLVDSVVFNCTTCGNIQTFVKGIENT